MRWCFWRGGGDKANRILECENAVETYFMVHNWVGSKYQIEGFQKDFGLSYRDVVLVVKRVRQRHRREDKKMVFEEVRKIGSKQDAVERDKKVKDLVKTLLEAREKADKGKKKSKVLG